MKLLRLVLPAAALAATLAPMAGAQAQMFFRPFGGVYYGGFSGPRPGPALGPYANRISAGAILARRGYDIEGPIERRGDVLIVHGYSHERGEARFVIDAYDGEILSMRRPHMALAREEDDDDDDAPRPRSGVGPKVLHGVGPADIRPAPHKPVARQPARRPPSQQTAAPAPRLQPRRPIPQGSTHMAVTPPAAPAPAQKPAPALALKPAAPAAPFLEQRPPVSPIIRSGG